MLNNKKTFFIKQSYDEFQLQIAHKQIRYFSEEKEKRAAELAIANTELIFQNKEKANRAAELVIANHELHFQHQEKETRAAELVIANTELDFQKKEKANRAAELVIANHELHFQHQEKANRAAELVIANRKLVFQNVEKEKRAAELVIANQELHFQNVEKEKRAAELVIANQELHFQNVEKEKRAAELVIANQELNFQNQEKEKRAAELVIANQELLFQNREKEKRAAELIIANQELYFQNLEKEKRAAELVLANKELLFENGEKEKRASELIIANKELEFQNQEKEKRAAEVIIANLELTNRTSSLIESEKKFRDMMETISQMAWTISTTDNTSFFNERWYEYIGVRSAEVAAQYWRNFIHPDDLLNTVDQFKRIQNGSVAGWKAEVRFKRADGEYRWHLTSILPIKDLDGNITLVVGTATDIQELKELHEQKDEFISIASHELKTPITTLKASLQFISKSRSNLSPKMMDLLLERANKSMEKVSRLIENLLNVSRFNKGQLHLNKSKFLISNMIGDCCMHFSLDGEYTTTLSGDLDIEVEADAERISQVITNFVNNSIKYAPESREVKVKIEKVKNEVKISVTDQGKGIDSEKLPHLFNRYFRVDSAGTPYSGLGLGLYISSEIIKKHGGQIGVESEPGFGSTFWFTLPLSP
jgi:PAS domain S-box-containing protein